MVALDVVHASNAQLRELGPGLVALFVGGTSGIGEFTLKAFVQNTLSPRVYIVGRSAPAAELIIKDCEGLNKDAKVEFLKANVSDLGEVDRVCREIGTREKQLNLLVQSQGNLTLAGRQENSEGLDRKMTLNYYSRMRFIHNLLPLLRSGASSPPHFSRTLSILGAGGEGTINLNDIELKKTYSGTRCAAHTISMNSLMTGEFASREPSTSFIHSYPSVVNTGIARELPTWARGTLKALMPLISPFTVGAEETGARQLFIATSGVFPPAKHAKESSLAAGTPIPKGLSVVKGGDENIGSGGYIVSWDCEITGKKKVLSNFREKGVAKTVWEHTIGVFDRTNTANEG